MQESQSLPATIVNVGVGSSPESVIWQRHFPDVELLGIDPRNRPGRWKGEYFQTVVGKEVGTPLRYCRKCQSVKCQRHEHEPSSRSIVSETIDNITSNFLSPYFIWIDIEGGEVEALEGATKTLQNTEWINIEMREFSWTKNYREHLNQFLVSCGFCLYFDHPETEDRIYRKARSENEAVVPG